MLNNPLRITEIDGKKPTDQIHISIQDPFKLKEGTTYKLEGYESGEFASEPVWLEKGHQQPFQFYSFFIVTKLIESKAK